MASGQHTPLPVTFPLAPVQLENQNYVWRLRKPFCTVETAMGRHYRCTQGAYELTVSRQYPEPIHDEIDFRCAASLVDVHSMRYSYDLLLQKSWRVWLMPGRLQARARRKSSSPCSSQRRAATHHRWGLRDQARLAHNECGKSVLNLGKLYRHAKSTRSK